MTRTRRLLLWFVCAAFEWPQAAWPQAAPPQPQPEVVSQEAPATFSSRINLVSVPVVIRDRKGHAVGGLKQEDFQLFDKGKAQVITKFSVETSAAAVKPALAAPPPELTASSAEPPAPPKPVLPGRFVAYLFDDIHTKPADLLNGRQAANRQLDRTLDANTRAGVFTTSGRTTQDFTADPEKLHAAINKIQPWERGLDSQEDCPPISYYLADMLINKEQSLSPGLNPTQLGANASQNFLAVLEETLECVRHESLCLASQCPSPLVSPTAALMDVEVVQAMKLGAQQALAYGMTETLTGLDVVKDLIRSMSALPGKRSIVMVGPGFLLADEHRSFENDIFEKAIRSSITINTLDVRGLATIPGMEASDRGHAGTLASVIMQADIAAVSSAQDLLAEFAAGTGGTFFHNDNGLEEGLDQLAAQPEYVYVLGFSPDNLKFDGSYHGLKVTLKTGAKLEIDARRGYWAPNHSISPAEEAKEEIEDAMFSREEALGIPVKVHTEFFKQSESKAELTVETHVDLKGLKFRKVEDRNRDTLTIVTGLFDQNGRYQKGTERTMDMQLRDETLDAGKNSGLTVKESFNIPPGRYVVRVVVRDTEGRSMAEQNEGVEIP